MFSECENVFTQKQPGACLKWWFGDVYFFVTQLDDALEIHIKATTKEALRFTRKAAADVIVWLKMLCPWCSRLIATVAKKTVYNLCVKVGFEEVYSLHDKYLMVYEYGSHQRRI